MSIYLINILSLIFWGYILKKNNDKKNIKLIIVAIIVIQFTLIQGFRSYSIGSDTEKYISYYSFMLNSKISLFETIFNSPFNFELGWMILMYLCKTLFFPPRLFIIAVSLIINSLIGYFIYKNSDNVIMSFWVFICVEYFSLSFTMLRQMIAIGIVANSFVFIKKQQPKKFFITIFIASLFHKTALIFLPFYLIVILYKKIQIIRVDSIKLVIGKIFVLFTFYLMIVFLFPGIISFILELFYGYYHFTKETIGILFFVMVGIFLMLIYFEFSYKKTDYELFIFESLICGASLLQLSTIIISQIYRGALYYYIFVIIIFPFLETHIVNKKNKFLLTMAIYLLTFLQYIFFSMNVYNLVPYSFF